MISLQSFIAQRDTFFEAFWSHFMSQLSNMQRATWKKRKPHMEILCKKMWDDGANTIISSLNEALENRSRIVVAQTVPTGHLKDVGRK